MTADWAWVTDHMSGILDGKRVLITGVLMESSIAFHAAKLAQEQGAEVILTAFPRPTLTERIAKKLPKPAQVIELDVTNAEHLAALAGHRAPGPGRPRRGRALHRLRARRTRSAATSSTPRSSRSPPRCTSRRTP